MNRRGKLLLFLLLFLGATRFATAADWPQWLGPTRDSRWQETEVIRQFPARGPLVKWRAAVHGGYSGPAVAGDRVFVMDYVTTGDQTPNPDSRNQLHGDERVVCLDRETGKLLWEHKYTCDYAISFPSGPRTTPAVDGDRVYTLGAEGDLHCLDVATGKLQWAKNFGRDFGAKTPLWGYCSHPTVVGSRLYCVVGGPGSLVVAFDKLTGNVVWHSQDAKEPGYSTPVLIQAGGTAQLLVWHAQALISVNPDSGELYWSEALEPDYGMAIVTPCVSQDQVFVGGLRGKSMMVQLNKTAPTAKVAWYGDAETGIDPIHSTPVVDGEHVYGVNRDGRLSAMQLSSGRLLWSNFELMPEKRRAHSGTVFIVKNDDTCYLMNDAGELVIARLSPQGYQELSRAKLLEPTTAAMGRTVVWSHPAFANRCIFARNDHELICVSLALSDNTP